MSILHLIIKIIFAQLILFSFINPTFANDTYDPFIDYSEYDDNGDEEADINFFKNGRQFTIHFNGGYTGLTGELGSKLFTGAINYGAGINFFLDLRLSVQFHYVISNHNFEFKHIGGTTPYSGSSQMSDAGLGLKYYVNTQNVIRNLAKLNPYFLLGFSYINRETKSATSSTQGAFFDSVKGYGANFGCGFEIQLPNKKFYIGGEMMYQLITFEDEGTEIRPNTNPTGIQPNGDLWRASALIGVNF